MQANQFQHYKGLSGGWRPGRHSAQSLESRHSLGQAPRMRALNFLRLNSDWNAEPNDPDPQAVAEGTTLRVAFRLNPFAYAAADDEIGILSFHGCSRWRWDGTNDHGWYAGEGRFAKEAPAWGELYELVGDGATLNDMEWQVIAPDEERARHFLFYFRDEALECVAADWSIERRSGSSPSVALGAPAPRP